MVESQTLENHVKEQHMNIIKTPVTLQKNLQKVLTQISSIIIIDKQKTITYVNEKFIEQSRYFIDELIGKNIDILELDYHTPEFYKNMWDVVFSGEIWEGIIKSKTKHGVFYWARITIVPTLDANKNLQNALLIINDITSHIDLSEKLVKSERLSAIGELSGRLAHDLRNPLSVMKMSVDLIKQNSSDAKVSDPVVAERIDLIEKSIDRISHQVDDVLGYVRNSPLKFSNISVRDLIEASIEKISIPNDVELNISGNDVNIDCDPVKLDAVFINLIINSIQAIHEGGKIEIKIKEEDNMVILEFIDSGDGIPEENINKIFEPLFTTKHKGTGLGLASVQAIINAHKGMISVTSPPTIFTITIPKISKK